MWNQTSLKEIADKAQRDRRNQVSEANLPRGYAATLDCLNQPDSWDVPGMIADMAENLRKENDVPLGQLLAAIDWMTFRLREAAAVIRNTNVTDESQQLLRKLKGY
jgi:hypothetical protein